MDRIVRLPVECSPRQPTSAPAPTCPASSPAAAVRETLDGAETIVRTLIANAGFAFDPPVILA